MGRRYKINYQNLHKLQVLIIVDSPVNIPMQTEPLIPDDTKQPFRQSEPPEKVVWI